MAVPSISLGQLLAYNSCLKKHLQVAFFGKLPDDATRQTIVALFRDFGISVSYFDDEGQLLVDKLKS